MAIRVRGLALPYNTPARFGNEEWLTMFTPGAFSASIDSAKSKSKIELWLNHRRAVLSRRCDGDIGLSQDDTGLYFTAVIDQPVKAAAVCHIVDCQALRGVSVGWDPQRVRVEWRANLRIIREARLQEVSLICNRHRPVFSQTWVELEAA